MKLPIRPMLAEKSPPPSGGVFPFPFGQTEGWAYEVKLDGHRTIAVVDRDATLYSRPGNVVTEYPELNRALAQWMPVHAVLDGEVVWKDQARTSRQRLSNLGSASREERDTRLRYVVFDILELGGADLTKHPYSERRRVLESIMGPEIAEPSDLPFLSMAESVSNGVALWNVVERLELEGLIAKPLDSNYLFGERGTWRKVKRLVRERFTVIGWTESDKGRPFAALVIGERTADGTWRYAGKVGTGFNDREQAEIRLYVDPFEQPVSPLTGAEQKRAVQHVGPRTVHWLRPAVSGIVEYSERSDDGTPIFPSWKGLVW